MTDAQPRPACAARQAERGFSPPTAEQLAAHLAAHPMEKPSFWRDRWPLAVLLGLAVVVLLSGQLAVMLLLWLALLAAVWIARARTQVRRQLERQVAQLQELLLLRRYPEGLRHSWRLLGAVRWEPALHGRVVAALAHGLEAVGAHEAAVVAFDHLLAGLPAQHPAARELRLRRAIASLEMGLLTDADASLRRVRGELSFATITPMTALYRFAQLLQDVHTAHYADACDHEADLLEQLRPLGVTAGYGHALMALCWARSTARSLAERREHQVRCWRRATLLLPVAALVVRYPELAALSQTAGAGEETA